MKKSRKLKMKRPRIKEIINEQKRNRKCNKREGERGKLKKKNERKERIRTRTEYKEKMERKKR